MFRPSRRFGLGAALLAMLVAAALSAPAYAGITDINPDVSSNSDADAATGGRVNGLASVAGNNQVFYAASEKGGLFKTTNATTSWTRLNTFLQMRAWDVAVDPSNANNVYATSGYDGRINSLSGIEVSTDAGATWTHPATANPPAAFTCSTGNAKTQPAAWGIAVQPGATQNVYIGTNCGLAISTNSGSTWTFVDPFAPGSVGNIFDVVAQSGGVIDVCGDGGHARSTNGGTNWVVGTGLPGGRCSIAASPDESYVLLVAASDNNYYETDDADNAAGANWTNRGTPDIQGPQGRIPFVATNQRSNSGSNNVFDLWYGDVSLYRGGCTTPGTRPSPDTGGSPRCPAGLNPVPNPPPASPPAGWAGPFTRSAGAHDDVGDIEFDTQASSDACPRVFSSDGGTHVNTDTGSDCQNPNWNRSNVGLHGLWLYGVSGKDQSGNTNEILYGGAQDTGSFSTTNAGANPPTWTNPNCCDTFDMEAGPFGVLGSTCCFGSGRFNRVELAGDGYSGNGQINTYPAGNVPSFVGLSKRFVSFGGNNVAMITSSGAFFTTNITASPIVWNTLGSGAPASLCGIQDAQSGGTTTFFLETGQCDGTGGDQIWSAVGTGGTFARIDNNDGITGGAGIFGVDPSNPNRMYISNPFSGNSRMLFSTDGGTNWDPDPELTALMGGNGAFRNTSAYPQAMLVAYDQENGNIMAAGGADSGIFMSFDGGANWSLVTDPLNGAGAKPNLPRPHGAYFDGEPAGTTNVYLGSEGRGFWRLAFKQPVASAGGPYTTNEGTDVTLDASASTDPDGLALTYAWDLDNDGSFDDATGASPVFDAVGQDGVFPVSVKVTNSDGAFSIASTTVTVVNVAPSFDSLSSDAPVDENTPVTVSGVISDPGWLDPLTATIDWGDGFTPVESISGTLENVRPDATFTFSVSHVYGDDGTFTAEVCGSDDDTTTCQSIPLQVDNVPPTATIDESGTTLVNGVPTFIAHAGDPITFHGRSTDPGSDDLALSWNWDDGPPNPDVTTRYLNDPLFDPDPDPSPSIHPRDVTDTQVHAFGDACLYHIGFSSLDDDAGSASDSANVIITGNADRIRSDGWWQNQYRAGWPQAFPQDTLKCYLAIVGFMSQVFDEERDASTIPKARDVLFLAQNGGSAREQLDRELITAWLNFANGAIEYGEPFSIGHADVPFFQAMADAEAVRLDPGATKKQLEAQKSHLNNVNEGHRA
jgi:hypothetical protein